MEKNASDKQSPFATEPIGRLIVKFAVPSVIALLVNSLYNIIDQIFIGWGVGYLGNGATNVVFPITIIALALSMMIGNGGAAYLSLKLGEGKVEDARKGVGNAIALATVVSILLAVIFLIWIHPILTLFGATEVLRPLALEYGYIIGIGLPFMMISAAINSMIRADGSPKYAMFSMVIGAIINVILDPVFIFLFHMGVQGAAIATVIGQIASFIVSVLYIRETAGCLAAKHRKNGRHHLFAASRKMAPLCARSSTPFCLRMQHLSLIADGGAAVAGLQRRKRIVGSSRRRARQQRNIHRVFRNSPGIPREQKGSLIHHVPAGVVDNIIDNGARGAGIQIGRLAQGMKDVVAYQQIRCASRGNEASVHHPRRRIARLIRPINQAVQDSVPISRNLDKFHGIRVVASHGKPVNGNVVSAAQKRHHRRLQRNLCPSRPLNGQPWDTDVYLLCNRISAAQNMYNSPGLCHRKRLFQGGKGRALAAVPARRCVCLDI